MLCYELERSEFLPRIENGQKLTMHGVAFCTCCGVYIRVRRRWAKHSKPVTSVHSNVDHSIHSFIQRVSSLSLFSLSLCLCTLCRITWRSMRDSDRVWTESCFFSLLETLFSNWILSHALKRLDSFQVVFV
ncbi:hypothetical protein BT96DRAFT_139432 [Gymnopus androsaceus JB14]|uniref:Uncharacterized protein n=1 Tax=Gymnopus androsaceus JB14 TaxID=1447944 RepID=A0A6A4HFI8_9AGAR|nr:hypothetical protein BT96DRAFT_139432 [Gymnopus androsaceus JB14]